MNLFNRLTTALFIGAMTLAPAAAFAAVDVTAVKTEIDGAVTPIGIIGAAVLLVLVAAKVYKWVRKAM